MRRQQREVVSLALAAEAKVSPHYTTDSLDNINGRIVMAIWKKQSSAELLRPPSLAASVQLPQDGPLSCPRLRLADCR